MGDDALWVHVEIQFVACGREFERRGGQCPMDMYRKLQVENGALVCVRARSCLRVCVPLTFVSDAFANEKSLIIAKNRSAQYMEKHETIKSNAM